MQSNSKLTKFEKQNLKNLKSEFPHVKFADNGENLVCAYFEQGNNIGFAFSIASPNEKKFRRKVGQYYAMLRVYDNRVAILPKCDFYHMREHLELFWGPDYEVDML